MPTAPRQHRQAGYQPPAVRRKEHDRRRGTAASRGYDHRWNEFAAAIKRDRVFCDLCSTIGHETAIISNGVADHIIPVTGPDDPLFWEPTAVWALCVACDRWKSINFDGSYGSVKNVAKDRSVAGVERRRMEIVERFRVAQTERGVVRIPTGQP